MISKNTSSSVAFYHTAIVTIIIRTVMLMLISDLISMVIGQWSYSKGVIMSAGCLVLETITFCLCHDDDDHQ